MTTAEPTLYAVRNHADPNETQPWICRATSEIDAAHQYLAEFWSAEQYDDGSWHSPTYEGDIDGDDLEIDVVDIEPGTALVRVVPGLDGAEWRIHAETDGLRVEHITAAGASVDHVLAENVYRSLSEALADIATVDQETPDRLEGDDRSDTDGPDAFYDCDRERFCAD